MEAKHLGSSRYVEQGKIIQLEVNNETGANHPFHLHGFSIQPLTLSNGGETFDWFKAGEESPESRDNINVPGGFTLKFRVRIDPRPMPDGTTPGGALGRWLFHCHIFFHATNGMLSELVVTGPGGNERPDVNFDNSEPAVTQGGTATVTGTYKDPDGDPVKLSSSLGTVTDNGGGKFTWSYPTKVNESSGLVYVTATDSHNLAGQDALFLKVATHGPPVITHLKVVPKSLVPGKAKTALKRASASKKRKKGAKDPVLAQRGGEGSVRNQAPAPEAAEGEGSEVQPRSEEGRQASDRLQRPLQARRGAAARKVQADREGDRRGRPQVEARLDHLQDRSLTASTARSICPRVGPSCRVRVPRGPLRIVASCVRMPSSRPSSS